MLVTQILFMHAVQNDMIVNDCQVVIYRRNKKYIQNVKHYLTLRDIRHKFKSVVDFFFFFFVSWFLFFSVIVGLAWFDIVNCTVL
jgi:hypothetical protein